MEKEMKNRKYTKEIALKFVKLLKEQHLDKIIEQKVYEKTDDAINENYEMIALFYKRAEIFENYLVDILDKYLNKNGEFYYKSNASLYDINNEMHDIENCSQDIFGTTIKNLLCNNVNFIMEGDENKSEVRLNISRDDHKTQITYNIDNNKNEELVR